MCPSFGHLLVATCEMDRVIACWDKELFSDHGKGPFFELIYKSTLNVELCVTSFISQSKALFICRNVPPTRLTRIPELLCASHHHKA